MADPDTLCGCGCESRGLAGRVIPSVPGLCRHCAPIYATQPVCTPAPGAHSPSARYEVAQEACGSTSCMQLCNSGGTAGTAMQPANPTQHDVRREPCTACTSCVLLEHIRHVVLGDMLVRRCTSVGMYSDQRDVITSTTAGSRNVQLQTGSRTAMGAPANPRWLYGL